MLQQDLINYKPLVDKLNKTGHALAALCNEEDSNRINDLLAETGARFENLKENVRGRGGALDEALQHTTQFADRLDGMLEALSSTADQVKGAEPISVHPQKLREQIRDNCAIMQDLDQKSNAYHAVKEAAAEVIRKADPNDPEVHQIKEKLNRLDHLWMDVQKSTGERGRNLAATLEVAEQFWDQLHGCIETLHSIRQRIEIAEAPACDPEGLHQQQIELQSIETEIQAQAEHVETCRAVGNQLLTLVHEPAEQLDVRRKIDELDSAWNTVTSAFAKRHTDLVEAMDRAMNYHDLMGNVVGWLEAAETRFDQFGPVGSDLLDIQRQIDELGSLKNGLDSHAVSLQELNQQAATLMENTSPEQATAVKRPLQVDFVYKIVTK